MLQFCRESSNDGSLKSLTDYQPQLLKRRKKAQAWVKQKFLQTQSLEFFNQGQIIRVILHQPYYYSAI
jgi:hypothetical protein